jgi:hypothetical protein
MRRYCDCEIVSLFSHPSDTWENAGPYHALRHSGRQRRFGLGLGHYTVSIFPGSQGAVSGPGARAGSRVPEGEFLRITEAPQRRWEAADGAQVSRFSRYRMEQAAGLADGGLRCRFLFHLA